MSIIKRFDKYPHGARPIYIEVYGEKAHVVKKYLKPLIIAISNTHSTTVKDVEYYIKIAHGEVLGEYVRIEYACGSEREIDVTASSLSAIAMEVLREVG